MSSPDGRRIALIGIRTGAGEGAIHSDKAEAIVVGDVKVGGAWEWRYAIFRLNDLKRLMSNASREVAKHTSLDKIPHPLDGPGVHTDDFYKPYYYEPLGAGAQLILGNSEKNDLLSPNDLPTGLIARLQEPIHPYVDDAGMQSPNAVSRLNFALPMRDVVRLAIYDKDNQPFGKPETADNGPLATLDTCRYVNPLGKPDPEQPGISNDPLGSRIILMTDPMAIDHYGPNKNKQNSARGKLFGFAVSVHVRLPLNGHDTSDGRERGYLRLFAVGEDVTPPAPPAVRLRNNNSLFEAAKPGTRALGPLFDSMRIGYSLGSQGEHYNTTLQRGLCFNALVDVQAFDSKTGSASYVPILDQLNIGITTDSVIRTMGFRMIDAARMALRFEAIYFITRPDKIDVAFAPALGLQQRNIMFAQEQPSTMINWSLSQHQRVSWIFTARNYKWDSSDAAVTKAVLDAFNARVEELQDALRQTKDATPLSFLPRLTMKDGDRDSKGNPLVPTRWHDGSRFLTSPAWHFVGSLVDRRPFDRQISKKGSKAKRSLWEIDAEFLTLEPRFIDEMFDGEEWLPDSKGAKGPFGVIGEFGILASAEFPRLVLTSRTNPVYDVVLSAPVYTDPSEAQSPPWVSPPALQPAVSGRDPSNAFRGVMLTIKVIGKTASSAPARIGALQIALESSFKDENLERDGMIRLLALKQDTDAAMATSAIDVLIKLPVGSVLPGGQDDLPADAMITSEDRALDALRDSGPDPDAALLLPLKPPAAARTQLTLFANETIARHRNHTVAVSLKAIQTGTPTYPGDPSGKLLVIDPAPFRVGLVKTIDIASAQTNQSNEVAVWNAAGENGLSWRLVNDAGTISLLLPPQVIGEAMEKNCSTEGSWPADIAEGAPAAARIGSATRLELSPSYFDTRYVEPGWNLRRIMGYPGQRAPGAGLRDLRLELMYGILTRVKPSDSNVRVAEIGAAIGAPANNISADGSTTAVQAYIRSFNAMRIAQNRRLAVDRLWRGQPLDELTIDQDASFKLRTRTAPRVRTVTLGGPLHTGDTLKLAVTPSGAAAAVQLSYTLTANDTLQTAATALVGAINADTTLKQAGISADDPSGGVFSLNIVDPPPLVASSVTGANATTTLNVASVAPSGPLTAFRWPIPGGTPDDLEPALHDTFRSEASTAGDTTSFAGGVPWAFESSNILRSVYRNVASDGGWVRNVHLSALGGWGTQRGLFDQKMTAITTETTMGRVHRYALERIGRVGALWNKAKHIIVYERSVVPSAQFYNTAPIGRDQDELRGRPVLRKVEEYVELIEQIRRYPEQGNAIEAAGCLTGVEFVARRIRVDNRWGGDVRREGWQVPLWNKAFDRPPENPDNPDDPAFVYPKPQIRFLVIGEGGVEKALEIAEPEKLVFYTTTSAALRPGEVGDNSDTWHPVRDVDFLDMPLPQAGKRQPATDDLHDGLLPPEPEHVGGYERFTIGIVPSKDTAAITHGRQEKGPVALLRNMTIGRTTAIAPPPSDPTHPTAADVVTKVSDAISTFRLDLDALTGSLSEVARVAATVENPDPAMIKQAIKDKINALPIAQKIQGYTSKFSWPDRSKVTGLASQLCAEQTGRITVEVDAQTTRAKGVVNDLVQKVDQVLTAEINQIKGTAALLVGEADGAKQTVKNLVNGLSIRLTDLATTIEASLGQAAANGDAIAAKIGAGVDSVIVTLQAQKDAAIANINATLDNITKNDVPAATATLNAARGQLQTLRAQIGQLLADASSNTLSQPTRTVLLVLDQTLVGVAASADKALGELSSNLNAAKTDVIAAQKAVNDISKALNDRAALAATGAVVSNVTKAIDGLAQLVQHAVVQQLDSAQNLIKDIKGKIETLPLDQITQKLNQLADTIAAVPAGLKENVDATYTQFQADVDAAKTALTNTAKTACDAFEGAIGAAYDTAAQAKGWVDQQLAGYQAQLNQAIDNMANNAALFAQNAQNAITQVGRQMEARTREMLGGLQQRAADYLGGRDPTKLIEQSANIFQQGSDTLRLIRAVGDPPKTDQLGFNRPQVAYVFQEANKIVDMTPAISLVNRVADSAAALGKAAASADNLLTSFGIRLPASAIGDQMMPDALKNLDISKLFPDFGGIKLDGLFKNLGFPDLSDSKAVKVSHGFDQVELSAWLQADVDVPFDTSAPLMDFGPVQILIDQAQFTASARLSEGRAGTQKAMNGKLFGDWRLVCAGQTILTFTQTALTFDQTGRINFNIQPDRVELADALQFLTDMIESTGQEGGFEIVPYMFGGVPSGIAARLDMELPPIQTGVFGITDLSLHLLFGVTALPEFEIITELGVGAMVAPFTLNVWILNGGGFVTTRLSYMPMHKPESQLMFTLQVGIVAGVGLGFSFGVVSGGVWVQVGCAIAITWTTGPGGSTTSVTVFLLVRGNVDVAGLITIGLSLLLAISYDGAKMVASGTLNLSIKISVFFTLTVSEHVEYDFAGGKKESHSVSYSDSFH